MLTSVPLTGVMYTLQYYAGVVKLADTPDLGSGDESHGGSSPSARTNF